MSAVIALQSGRFYKTRLITSSLIALAWCAEAAAQTANVAPPPRYILDENGVNLATGAIVTPRVDISIGPKDDPLEFINFGGSQQFTNLALNVYNGVPAVMGPNGPVSVSTSGANGETVTYAGGVYTATLADGTKYTYANTDQTTWDVVIGNGFNARVTEIKYPNGQKVNFYYKKVTYTCPNSSCSTGGYGEVKVRLQSIVRSDGYQIHFNYKSNLTSTGQQQSDWGAMASAAGFNRANEYCDPALDICNLTQQWPVSTYSTSLINGNTVAVVTTAQGTHQYWGTYDANGYYNFYQRPGATTWSRKDSYSTVMGSVASITDNGVTTLYNWNLVQSGFYPIINTMTTTRTNPDGTTRSVVTNQAVGTPSSITDETGGIYALTYDPSGRVTQATAPEGRYTAYTYDARGNITAVTNAPKPGSGLANIVTTASFAASCTNAFTCNQPIWTRDALGNQTDYTYDPTHGGIVTITAPADAAGVRPQSRFSYTSMQAYYKGATGTIVASGAPTFLNTGQSTCLTATTANPASCVGTADESKKTVSFGPQTAGVGNNLLSVAVTTAAGNGSVTSTTAFAYDKIGNQTAKDGPLTGTGDTTVYRFDGARRMVGVVNPDPDGAGARIPTAQRMGYNGDGQVTLAETGTVADQTDTAWASFASQQQVASTYDANARLARTSVTAGGTTYAVSQLNYDSSGRVKCQAVRMDPAQWTGQSDACLPQTTSANGPDRVTQTNYDGLDRVTSVTEAVGTADAAVSETRTYTADGLLGSIKDGENNLTTYEYDGFDRQAKTRYPVTAGGNASSTTDFEQLTYDANSKVTQQRLREGTIVTNTYDGMGRLTSRTPAGEETVLTQYNLQDQVTQLSVNPVGNATVTSSYDAMGRLTSEVEPFGTAANQYDSAGRRTRITWSDGLFVTYDYDTLGNVTAIRENGAASGVGVLATYSYDNLGRRTGIARGNGTTTSYGFDPVSRLQSLTQDLAGTANDQTIGSITYNPAGQIVSQVRSNDGYAWNGHYNVNRGYNVNGLNQLTAAGAIALGYDGRGNLITSGTSTYTYDKRNRMSLAPNNIGLGYDASGRMSKFNVAGATQRFAYAGNALIQESFAGLVTRRYVPGPGMDEPVVWYEGAGTADRRWLHADERGSVIAVTDGSGAVLGINRYDEFGIPQSSNIGRFQYTGQAWLPELGMYNYKARIYSPTLGRFMQTDPIGYDDGLNWYNYVHSDPINGTDPTGTEDGGPNTMITVTGSVIRLDFGSAPGISIGTPANMGSLNLGGFALPVLAQAASSATSKGTKRTSRSNSNNQSDADKEKERQNKCAIAFGIAAGGAAASFAGSGAAVLALVPTPASPFLAIGGTITRFVGSGASLAAGAYIAANCR